MSAGLRRGAAATAAARAAAVIAQKTCQRGGDAHRSDCLLEVADVEQAIPGPTDAASWVERAKVVLQQSFKRFGSVLDIRIPNDVAKPVVTVRFANSKGAEAAMVAAKQGFLKLGESEVRLCQPTSKEAVWRKFAMPRKSIPLGEPKKKKLRPNERFAPPKMMAPEFVDEDDLPERPPVQEAEKPKAPPPNYEPPQQLPPEPERPAASQTGPESSEEDRAVAVGEAEVAGEMAAILEQPFSKQKKALKALRLRWHPDKNPENAAVATRVFQFVQRQREIILGL